MTTAVAPPPVPKTSPVRVSFERQGEIARIVFGGGAGNPFGLDTVIALHETVSGFRRHHDLKLIAFQGEGPDFSIGAPLTEYTPENVGRFLPAFHHLVRELEDIGIPTAALVRGRCYGAAFELVSTCGTILCDATARFAASGVALGTVPAVAAIALPWRVGGARATEMVVSGRIVAAPEALAIHLADRQARELDVALNQEFDERLAPRSALVVRYAWRAARNPLAEALERDLPRLAQLVLDDLMTHRDALEAIRATLESRRPVWTQV